MIALKSRFLLLAAFCTFAAVQGSAIPLDERALPKARGNATTGHSPSRDSTYHHGTNTTRPHATNNTSYHHATNDTSSGHGRKYHESPAASADDRKHHSRQMEESSQESVYASYQVYARAGADDRKHHSRQMEESLSASAQVYRHGGDVRRREVDHHHDDDWHHHHHHSRDEATEPTLDIFDPLLQIGAFEISDNKGPTVMNSHPLITRDVEAQSIFHTKRGDTGGVPGTVDIVMASSSPERVASLVMTPNNATASDNSTASDSTSGNGTAVDPTSGDLFVLDASNTTSTQFFMTPISNDNSTGSVPDVPANNALVSLQVPVFVPTNVSLSQYCATYDPNPSDPVTIGMRECSDDLMAPAANSSSHASQAFLYDTGTGVLSPIWFSSNGSTGSNSTDTLSRRDGLDQFTVGESGDDITPADSTDSTTASTSSADPASTDSASSISTDSPAATPTDVGTSSSTDTDAAATTATDATDASSATASSTTSGSTPAETSAAGPDGGIAPQDVTLVFTPSGPAVPMGGVGNSNTMSSSSTDPRTDDATTLSQTPAATEALATPTDTSTDASSTEDSVGSSTVMPTASSEMSDAPTSTEDSEATSTVTDSDSMATSTSMSVDDSFVSSSAMDTPAASSTGSALDAASTASGTETAESTLETGGSQAGTSTASAPTGSMIVDSDSIERMFNAHF